jgi:amino acid adenylation domain-containing protein/non-ribosomal peptide synthase protein (TIGR01720 family)
MDLVEYNYLGQFDQVIHAESRFQVAPESAGPEAAPGRRRRSTLGLGGMIFGGELSLRIDYSPDWHDAATIDRLAIALREALKSIVARASEPETSALTPSDFPFARIGQATLDRWQQRHPQVQKLYRATPMQAGLHFHHLLDRSAYVVQTYPVIVGDLDVSAFHAAWQQVVLRHDALRTAFVADDQSPHQLVLPFAALPWHEEDWCGLPAADQVARFTSYREADHAAGFDFERPPLMRVAVFRLGEDRYQLLWTLHHIILDGWCMPLVYRDVMALYRASVEGSEASLPRPPDYERYIGWLASRNDGQAREHWRTLLAVVDAPTPLPADLLGPADGQSDREAYLALSDADTARLRDVARAQRTTVNTLVQWSWAYLLHRYSGEDHIVFGATISGRPAEVEGIEGMVGLFINTVPVVVSFAEEVSVATSLARLQDSFRDSVANGHLSLADIQRESSVRAGTPLFDTLLSFENYPTDSAYASASPGSLSVESTGNVERSGYGLGLIGSLERTLSFRCTYRSTQFSERRVTRLLEHLGQVLRDLPAALDQERQVTMLDAAEEAELLAWGTSMAMASTVPLHEVVRRHAHVSPASAAVVSDGLTLSFAALDEKSNRLACSLAEAGVGRGSRTAICMDRSADMLVAILGTLKAGASYVPLDPALPMRRLNDVMDDAGVDTVLVHTHHLGALGLRGMDMVPMDGAATDDDWLAPYAGCVPDVTTTAADLAYVLFTSGSTGRPKGVMVHHGGLSTYLAHAATAYLADVDGGVVSSPLAFDATLTTLLAPLTVGKPVTLLPDDQTVLTRLADAMFKSGSPQLFKITPAHLEALAYLPVSGRNDTQHVVVIGGDQLSRATLTRWKEDLLPAARFVNEYGPTETVVGCTMYTVDEALAMAGPQAPSIPIGRPIAGAVVRVLDGRMRMQPTGSIGELYIGGPCVAQGYANRDDLTVERFIPDLSGGPRARMYRTGDMVRWRTDGELEFVGRRDHQVKVRGFRIELGDVEQHLSAVEGIASAVVVAHADDDAGTRLIAYVVPSTWPGEQGTAGIVATCRDHLLACLPVYMLPSAIVPLEVLPTTANGKVDRKALPALDGSVRGAIVMPFTPTEHDIAELWKPLLKLDAVDVETSFFELGGHSLTAIRMLGGIRARLGVELTIRDIFDYPTVRSLARHVDEARLRGSLREDVMLRVDDQDERELIEL